MDSHRDLEMSVSDMLGPLEGELLCGFLDGVLGVSSGTEPCSVAYRHGWRNGAIEAGWLAPDTRHAAGDGLLDRLRDPAARLSRLDGRYSG